MNPCVDSWLRVSPSLPFPVSIFLSLIFLSVSVVSATGQSPAYTLTWISSGPAPYVEACGIPSATLARLQRGGRTSAQWQRLLAVYTNPDPSFPPMPGAWRVADGALRFTPQFPPEPGIAWRAIFHPAALPGHATTRAAPLSAVYQPPPRAATPAAIVSQIYPSADTLPENLLKFYLTFSAPMSRGRSYDHIQLLDEAGKPVELPFLELDEELWNPDMTRFTLLIDPGRIKRGVLPLEEIGPSLEEGKSYTLVVSSAWRDARNNPLATDFRKIFRVTAPDRAPIDPAQWRIEAPTPGTRDLLAIHFGEPLDAALAQRVLNVVTASGALVNGTVTLAAQESRWEFRPARPWAAGDYQLLIEATLEDLAGNNIGKPFEVDLFAGVQRRVETQIVKLPFAVR
ncbi:MAG: Ig-like domain-containing protein [Blastocatellia bacterium]